MVQTAPHEKLKKVLIVEDEGDICLLLNIMLKGKEIELEHVKTLTNAKTFLEKEVPALILLDNQLPDGLGIDFIGFIKSSYPSVKIIMISGYQASSTKDIALKNGADIYIEKPFTKEEMYRTVQTLLN